MKRLVYGVLGFGVAVALAMPATVDAGAKIKFKYPKRLDTISMSMRGIPSEAFDPANASVAFSMFNDFGPVFYESLGPGLFVPNAKGNKWKYKKRKTGSEEVYSALIKERFNKTTLDLEYILTFKAVGNTGVTDPLRNVGPTELANITHLVSIGFHNFYINALWERVPKNTDKPVKGWKLTDKYMSGF
jgi:hypothetical protein